MQKRTIMLTVTGLAAAAILIALFFNALMVAAALLVVMLFGSLALLTLTFSQVRSEGATQRSNLASLRTFTELQFANLAAEMRSEIHGRAKRLQRFESQNHDNVTKQLAKISTELDELSNSMYHRVENLEAGEEKTRRQLKLTVEDLDALTTGCEASTAEVISAIDANRDSILEAQSMSDRRLAAWNDASRDILDSLEKVSADIAQRVRATTGSLGTVSERLQAVHESVISGGTEIQHQLSSLDLSVKNQFETSLQNVGRVLSVLSDAEGSRQDQFWQLSTAVSEMQSTRAAESAAASARSADLESALVNRISDLEKSSTAAVVDLRSVAEQGAEATEGLVTSLATGLSDLKSRQTKEAAKLNIALYAETQQTEALLQLLPKVRPRWMLPSLGRWALDAKAMLHLYQIVEDARPSRILELGSGTSTVWLGYIAETIGASVVSIEHDSMFKQRTEELVRKHGLVESVSVVNAPLEPVKLGGREYSWYSRHSFGNLHDIDLLLVDGPIGSTNRWARYPAVPILWPVLSENAIVALDDSDRSDESDCIGAWTEQFPLTSLRHDVSRLAVMRAGNH